MLKQLNDILNDAAEGRLDLFEALLSVWMLILSYIIYGLHDRKLFPYVSFGITFFIVWKLKC